ncbi:hypothetical protein N5T98_04875 [Aliarcobacter cryaerophilus]|uniref:hypothetical protein n=1 Tax=Aliarcobacter cryaerophilus TaxID=28198 RepID=UPI0021B6C9DC|nr:hypothetical protein [Aliarcobacter cryaerophilus]MCT7486359.1 hypothetical protein [Aliarcobacter cryaerophilus]MCT7490422.1 hypothetical protein [Aliarcobacter cryaerophilus]
MIDKETGYKIIELKAIGLSDVITKHDRLLRSLDFGDEERHSGIEKYIHTNVSSEPQ